MLVRGDRQRLAQDLRRLATGRVTNDEFDDLYVDQYRESDDEVVRELSEFGYGLYSSDLLIPYRLTGRHALASDRRRMVARCVLFLRTDRPYEWPMWPLSRGSLRLAADVAYFGRAIGLVITICCVLLLPAFVVCLRSRSGWRDCWALRWEFLASGTLILAAKNTFD